MELQQICLLFYFRHRLCDSVCRGLVGSAYLHHASVLRITVHHVIKGCEKVSQRLHEISLSVVLVETGRGWRREIHWQMITKLLFVSSKCQQAHLQWGWGWGFDAFLLNH